MRRLRLPLLLCVLAAWAGIRPARAFEDVQPLTGRRIAAVCGAGPCAVWLNRPEREQEEHPDAALDALHLKRGMTVADIGAGTGYMSLKLSKRVGPTGKVYAEDVQPEMIQQLRANAQKAHASNIEPVLGTITDPKLPPSSLDLALLVDVYHEFSEPEKMLQSIRAELKPDGRLVLIEYRKEDPTIPIQEEHKMTVAEARTEVEAEGFTLQPVIEILPRQHILIFTKKAASTDAGKASANTAGH